jgi:2-polyprenyl-6-methoxyphenol hydroxylase-like FAD-dependent oxidoreductase
MNLGGARATVIGAGIGGAATALLLARAGAEVTVLERERHRKAIGTGIILQPNGMAVLAGLGLAGAIEKEAHCSAVTTIRDAEERELVSLPTPAYGPGLDHVVALRRSHLVGVIGAALDAEPRITVRFGARATAVEMTGKVHFLAPEERMRDAELVVGADGVGSRARHCLPIRDSVRTRSERYFTGVVAQAAVDKIVEYWTPYGMFGIAPVGTGTYFVAAASARAVAQAIATEDLNALRRVWGAALPRAGVVLDRVGAFHDLLVDDVLTVECNHFDAGRAVLVGDAAHAMRPNAGQGGNSALVDAAVLSYELAAASDITTALRSYDARRRPKVREVQKIADRLVRLSTRNVMSARRMRDAYVRSLITNSRKQFDVLMQEDPAWLQRVAEAAGA